MEQKALYIGLMKNGANKNVAKMSPRLETAGRAIFHGSDCPRPSAVTILTITRTIISSSIAAPAIKVPVGVFCKFADASIMNVDPSDVEHRETPAEKAANAVGYLTPSTVPNFIPIIEKERAIGASIPTIAADKYPNEYLANESTVEEFVKNISSDPAHHGGPPRDVVIDSPE
ncbi:hypothetical protein NHQ30_001736 [Ciborinia camelliae]|nr:hypothetical protein NHQ30_001736 [Ciborinia camelliae]